VPQKLQDFIPLVKSNEPLEGSDWWKLFSVRTPGLICHGGSPGLPKQSGRKICLTKGESSGNTRLGQFGNSSDGFQGILEVIVDTLKGLAAMTNHVFFGGG
jgi:hypothetical protein